MYDRARIAILNHICSYSLQQEISGRSYPAAPGHRFDLEAVPVVGDLVALKSAPPNTPFYLAWVEQVGGDVQGHLLRSVEDGSLCDWTNVGFMVFDRGQVAANPHWRWTDGQFEFNHRWSRAFSAAGLNAAYRRRPVTFDGEGCTIQGERQDGGVGFSRSFPSWRDLDEEAIAGVAREVLATA